MSLAESGRIREACMRAMLALTTGLLPALLSQAQDHRIRLPLSDKWESVTLQTPALEPPAVGWKPRSIPGVQRGTASNGTEFTWYRRVVEIPESWAGQRSFLHLGGARFHPHVFLDGVLVGRTLDGWTPFELELKDLTAGRHHTLEIRCQDWSATFSSPSTIPDSDEHSMRAAPQGKVIAPIGGRFFEYGIWDNVWLEARPKTFVGDYSVVTSVREKSLQVSGGCEALAGFNVRIVVRDADKEVLQADTSITDGKWIVTSPLGGIRLWSPEDPYLYRLEILLLGTDGKTVDAVHQRVGFCEFWADGPDFYLNGVKRHLLASSCWPSPTPRTPAEMRTALRKMREGNILAFRMHTQPWRKGWLEAADEVGMLMIQEGALWCDSGGSYAYKDPRLWTNIKDHLKGMVLRDRNHPSLIMWSIENEILHCGATRHDPDLEKKLADVGRFVKKIDPGHLITYEADLDPDGVADVIGLHYPHELPEHHAYPNTANWLGSAVKTGTGGALLGSRSKAFQWSRNKPLYIGEYLWVPYEDYSPGSVFFGDLAHTDRKGFNDKARAEAWKHQTIAYRKAGVSGLCPWTPVSVTGELDFDKDLLFRTQKAAYEPVAAFIREHHTRTFCGRNLVRTFDVFNDSVSHRKLWVRWALFRDQRQPALDGGGEFIELGPAENGDVVISFPVLDAEYRTRLTLKWLLFSDTEFVLQGQQAIDVFPDRPIKSPSGRALSIYDPSDGLRTILSDTVRLNSLNELSTRSSRDTLLLIGPNAFAPRDATAAVIGQDRIGVTELRHFLVNGGATLVLEQETLEGLPFQVTLTEHVSTMTFPLNLNHPVMSGLKPEDFKFWANDHYVARKQILRPARGGVKALTVSGGPNGVAQSPLVDMPVGHGRAILCQSLVGQKYDSEPAARNLLQNALNFLAEAGSSQARTSVVTTNHEFVNKLVRLGLRMERVQGAEVTTEPRLLILHGGGSEIVNAIPAIQRHLQREWTNVYWHAPDADTFASVRVKLGFGHVNRVPAVGPVQLNEKRHTFTSHVAREDLTFVGKPQGASWMRGFQQDPRIIDSAFVLEAEGGNKQRIAVKEMKLEGQIARLQGDEAHFYTSGSASFTASAKEEGLYPLTVIGRGSPAADVFPLVEIKVNDSVVASVNLDSKVTAAFSALVKLPAGEAKISLVFANDQVVNGQDRNMFLTAAELGEEPVSGALEMLTLPSALVVVPSSNGKVILDSIRWDNNPGNEERGLRYASTLLANLGGSFEPPASPIVWLEPSKFQLVNEPGFFKRSKTELLCAAKTILKASFNCASDGSYRIVVKGRSSPVAGVYAAAAISVDDQQIEEVFLNSQHSAEFEVSKPVKLSVGEHSVTVDFVNDLNADGEDRNLYLNAVGFCRAE